VQQTHRDQLIQHNHPDEPHIYLDLLSLSKQMVTAQATPNNGNTLKIIITT